MSARQNVRLMMALSDDDHVRDLAAERITLPDGPAGEAHGDAQPAELSGSPRSTAA